KFYKAANLLHEVDGNIDIDQVTDTMLTIISSLQP
ncbi:MAG: adenylate kinase, partial [Chloroflexi bacterium]|nr:adenylate kinase [Chloroflexota bacterium]